MWQFEQKERQQSVVCLALGRSAVSLPKAFSAAKGVEQPQGVGRKEGWESGLEKGL